MEHYYVEVKRNKRGLLQTFIAYVSIVIGWIVLVTAVFCVGGPWALCRKIKNSVSIK